METKKTPSNFRVKHTRRHLKDHPSFFALWFDILTQLEVTELTTSESSTSRATCKDSGATVVNEATLNSDLPVSKSPSMPPAPKRKASALDKFVAQQQKLESSASIASKSTELVDPDHKACV